MTAPVISAIWENDANRVAITIEPCPGATHFQVVQRARGTSFSWFVQETPAIEGGPTVVYDYMAPIDSTVEYTAFAYNIVDSDTLSHRVAQSEPVTVETRDNRHWLKHPEDIP